METESLKELGIVMTQANLESFAMSKGIDKNIKDMTEAEKVNLRYAFVLEKTKNAQGDFTRTSDGAANSTRILWESFKELGQIIGAILLPMYTKVVQGLIKVVKAFKDSSKQVQVAAVVMGILTAAIPPLIAIVGTAMVAWATFGATISAIALPITAALIAIGALTYAAWELYTNWEDVRDGFKITLINLHSMFVAAMGAIEKLVIDMVIVLIDKIASLGSFIIKIFPKIGAGLDTVRTAMTKLNEKASTATIQKELELADKKTNILNGAFDRSRKKNIELATVQQKNADTLSNLNKTINVNTDDILKNVTAVDELEESTEELVATQEDLERQIIDSYDSMGEGISTALKNMYDKQINMKRSQTDTLIKITESSTNREIAQYEKVYNAKLMTLDAETREAIKTAKSKIDAIDNLTKEEEKQLDEQTYQREVAEKIKAIADEDSADKKSKLQIELNDLMSKRERELLLESRNRQKASLEEEITNIRDQASKKEEALKLELEANKKNLNQIATAEKARLNASFEQYKEHHESLLTEESINAKTREMIINNNQEDIVKLIESYNPQWKSAGKSLGENLLAGISTSEQAIKSKLSSLLGTINTSVRTASTISDARSSSLISNASSISSGSSLMSKAAGVVVNVTGNTISGIREAEKMASSIVSKLRMAGVTP